MKLGELFVDLGVNSGGAFNALSSFAFKLTNIANLGETVTRYVDEFFGEAPKWASNMRMLSRNVDLTTQELQDLEESAKVSQIDLNTAIGTYKRLWSEYYSFVAGGFKDEGYMEKWSKYFGPDVISELTENIREPIDLINLLDKALSQVENKADLMAIRDIFGMSAEMQQTFRLFAQGGVGVTNVPDEAQKKLSILKETIETLNLESERQHSIWVAKLAPMFTDWIRDIYDLKSGYYEATISSKSFFELLGNSIDYIGKKMFFMEKVDKFADKLGEKIGKFFGDKPLDEEGKRRRNEYWIEEYGHPYDKDYVKESPKKQKKQIHSSIDLEKPRQTMMSSNNVFSPTYNNTIYTTAGNVGDVIEQTTQTSINAAKNGNMELMLGRGMVS